MRPKSRIHRLTAAVGIAACLGWAARNGAAEFSDDVLQQLRTYRYGQDPKVLTEVSQAIATVTSKPGEKLARDQLAQRLAALLGTDASFECQQFVCRQLALIGTPKQVPVLAKLLTDEKFSDMARYALGPMQDPAAGRALRAALGHARGKTLVGLINTLGFRQDPQAVKPLGNFLNTPDGEVVRATAAALGRIGGNEAARVLRRALTRTTADHRFALTDALLACADGFLAAGRTPPAAVIFRDLLAPNEAGRTRAAALRGLMTADEGAAPQPLLAGLRDPDALMKRAAIGCIRLRHTPGTSRQVAAELPRLPLAEQVLVLDALADRPDPVAVSAVIAATRSPDSALRVAAWRALGRIGDATAVAPLVSAATAGNAEEKNAALDSLRILRGQGTDEAVLRELSTPTAARVQLIGILVDRTAVNAVPALLDAAAVADPPLAEAAFRALGQLAAPASLPAMVRLLEHTRDDAVRRAAEDAAVSVARKIVPEENRADVVLAALRDEKETETRSSLLRVLGGIGDPKALAALETALREAPEAERETAVRVLADWPGVAAIPLLRDVFRNGQNETQRTLALRGFVRLVSQEAEGGAAETLPKLEEAMHYAKRAEERKLVLSGLATVSDARALALVEPHLGDAAVRDEAALAAVKIANAIAGTQRDSAKAAIQRALAASDNPSVREQANRVLQEIEKHEDFVTVWQVAGPYLQAGRTGGQLFDLVFAPETENDPSVRWRLEKVNTGANQPAILDLLGLLGGDNRVAYLRTWVHADQARPARLEIGTDDGVKVWLNGALVHGNNVDRGLTVGEDRVVVALKKGWNRLLLKITQDGGGWAACVRFRKPDGSKLDGVRFDSTREQAGASHP